MGMTRLPPSVVTEAVEPASDALDGNPEDDSGRKFKVGVVSRSNGFDVLPFNVEFPKNGLPTGEESCANPPETGEEDA